MTFLTEWQNFYVIVGSSAGALIGLQFVVMALIANRPPTPGLAHAGEAFITPTVVYFGTPLLISAIMSAPWHSSIGPVLLWGTVGILGSIYALIVSLRMRRQKLYRPEFEDWLFHAALPFAAYATLAVAAVAALNSPRAALFAVAGAALLLLFIGIHNAWDNVSYQVYTREHNSQS